MKGILIIRKYKNRRLYDTERSLHVTGEELFDIVRKGRNVQIQDASTGEDVTGETLIQFLINEKGQIFQSIPSEFIHFLVRSSETQMFEFFQKLTPQFQMNPFNSGAMLNPWAQTPPPFFAGWPGFQGFSNPTSPNPPPSNYPPERDPEEERDLERKLRDLEEKLNRLERLEKQSRESSSKKSGSKPKKTLD